MQGDHTKNPGIRPRDNIHELVLDIANKHLFVSNVRMFDSSLDELAGLSDAELIERVDKNEVARRHLDAEVAALLALVKELNIAGFDGHRTVRSFCRARLDWSWGRMLVEAGLSTSTDLDGSPIDPFTGLVVDQADAIVDEFVAPGGTSRLCETMNGVPLHPHDVLRAALAGRVRRAVVDSERMVIDLGRRSRLFSGSARRAAKLLIRGCEHAGCSLPAEWCEVDHVEPWQASPGETSQANAAVLCRFHNNDKHHRRWRTRRARNGCSYTIRADGTIIMPVGARPPEFADVGNTDPPAGSHSPDGCPSPDGTGSPDGTRHELAEFVRLAAATRNRFDTLVRHRARS